MLAKYGLVLLALVFGIVAFATGMLVPPSFKQELAQVTRQIAAKLPGQAASPGSAASAPAATSGGALAASASPSSSPSTTPAAATAPASAAAAASAPLPSTSLLLPPMAAASVSFALQAAQFSTTQPASQLAASIQTQGVTSTVVLMSEPQGGSWSVVTVGRFGSADEALSQRSYLSLKLGLPPNMGAIALPPPPK